MIYVDPLAKFQLGTNTGSINDLSLSARPVTITGPVSIARGPSIFGSPSAYFAGTAAGFLTLPTSTDFDVTGDFTVDLFFNHVSYANYNASGSGAVFWSTDGGGAVFTALAWKIDNAGNMQVYSSDGASWILNNAAIGATGTNVDSFFHYALVKNGTDLGGYFNGERVGTQSWTHTAMASQGIYIGGNFEHTAINGGLNGFMYGLRYASYARWADSFEPPALPRPQLMLPI